MLASLREPMKTHLDTNAAVQRDRARELMDLVGLGPHLLERFPRELSGGQLQRVAVARALVLDPKVLVLDEPVSSLDVSSQAQVVNLLKDLQARLGVAYLFIAHDLSVVRHVSHRVAVMYLGRIVEEGPAESIFNEPRHPYTEALLDAIPAPDPVHQRTRDRIILTGEIPSPAEPAAQDVASTPAVRTRSTSAVTSIPSPSTPPTARRSRVTSTRAVPC